MRDRVPWYVWTSLLSVTCILVVTYWDISWHMSIGRDSFWTPAHLAIQAGGILGGLTGAVLVFATTFRRTAPLRDVSIRVWGFRGPLGAFLGAWGAVTMVVSAPFDNWWHNAYGLDVKILSPPHAVLTLGVLGVAFAGILLVTATMNRATGEARARLARVVLAIGGEMLVLTMIAILEHTFRANLHRADAYRAIAIVAPVGLLSISRMSEHRWAATLIAGAYTAFMIAMVWLFPLIPAVPKLGPVYQPITHLIPLEFPMLLIVPAIAIDLVRRARPLATWPRWRLALVLGPLFLVALVAAEWPFATFMQSSAASNAVFGGDYFAYFMQPDWYEPRHAFMPDSDAIAGFGEAVVAAVLASWLGLAIGDAMKAVRR